MEWFLIWVGINVAIAVALTLRPERRHETQKEYLQRIMREHRCMDCSGSHDE